MFYYTYHSDMDVPQYVHVDVTSDYVLYNSHHRNMYIPQDVSPAKRN